MSRIGRWVPAVILAAVGVAVGYLLVTGILALPLSEGVLFGLGGLSAAVFLGGALIARSLWARAFAIGALVGDAGSLALVALIVIG